MERDEQDRAIDDQADATPPAVGYVPTLSVMRQIARATSYVRAILDESQRHSGLPCYPQGEGVGLALDALFRLERAVNPRRQRWRARQEARINTRVWPRRVSVGLRWARDLTADILERHELQWMAGATREEFQARLSDPSSLPEAISVEGDELLALDGVLELLPDLNGLLHPPEQPIESPVIAPIRCSKRALLRAMGKSEGYTELLKKMEGDRTLTIQRVHSGDGDGDHFEFTFADREEHRALKAKVEAEESSARAPGG